jgi:hypothetical protein
MNLAKLLGVGSSFFGAAAVVPYRLHRTRLPKFNEGRNPFAPKPLETELAMPQPEPKVQSAPAPARLAKGPSPFVLKAPAKAAVASAAREPSVRWTSRLNPFRPPAPAPIAAAEQTELSLDAVKVVHNDLADADVEIIPLRAHSSAPAPAVLPPARKAWEYMGESMARSS